MLRFRMDSREPAGSQGLEQDSQRVRVATPHVLGVRLGVGVNRNRSGALSFSSRTKGEGEEKGKARVSPSVICGSDGNCAGSPFAPDGPGRRVRSMQAEALPNAAP